MRVLVGDVGGTHTRFAIAEDGRLGAARRWPSEGPGLAPIMEQALAELGAADVACIGVAGPVFGGRAHLTNLGWSLDAAALSARFGVSIRLINDFHAQALAMPKMGPAHRETLAPTATADRPPGACLAVLGAGTGLGEAILAPDPAGGFVAVPGEGSHARFAPRDEREVGLLRWLWRRHPEHVSVERVVSGPGLVSVYDYLRGEAPRSPAMAQADPAAVIAAEALAGACPISVAALEIFVGVYADEAASLALQCNAGAVYLTGGITPKILPFLRPRFRAAFEQKGRYGPWLKTVPVHVVTHPDPGLIGALVGAERSAPAPR